MKTPGSVRAVVWATFLLRSGQTASAIMLGLNLARHTNGMEVSAATAGVVLTSSFAVEIVFAPVVGLLSDRFGRRPFLIAGPLLGLIAVQFYVLPASLPLIFAARALEGVGAAAIMPAGLGYMAEKTILSGAGRSRSMAYLEVAILVGIAGGSVAAGLLWQRIGVLAFESSAAMYLVAAALTVLMVREDARAGGSHLGYKQRLLSMLRQPRLATLALAWTFMMGITGLWSNNVVFQMAGRPREGQHLVGGTSGDQVSFGLAFLAVALVLGTIAWSRLFPYFQRKTHVMLICQSGTFGACLVLWGFNHYSDSTNGAQVLFMLLLGLAIAVSSGFTPAALSYMADITDNLATDRGAIMALYSVFLGIGQLGGGLAGGSFAQAWSLDGLVYLNAILVAIAILAVLRLSVQE
ncbi:MAG: MFS transporter, partial [Chloroflexota bacterium]